MIEGLREIRNCEWRKVDVKGKYWVSEYGDVVSTRFNKLKEIKHLMHTQGYHIVNLYINGPMKKHRVHQLVARAFLPMDLLRDKVDHINGDKSDNHVSNLRWASNIENIRGYNKPRNGTSKYRGVCYCRKDKKWVARCMVNGKRKRLGTFEHENDAARAWNEAAINNGYTKEALNRL